LAKGLRVLADETKLAETMHAALAPDVAAAKEFGFIHRKLPEGEIYFLANTSNHTVRTQAKFRVQGLQAQQWNPFTGEAVGAGGNPTDLEVAPYESRAIVFARSAVKRPDAGGAPTAIDVSGWRFSAGTAARSVSLPHSWVGEEGLRFYSGAGTYETSV